MVRVRRIDLITESTGHIALGVLRGTMRNEMRQDAPSSLQVRQENKEHFVS